MKYSHIETKNETLIFVTFITEKDAGGIPTQFPVQEDTLFCQILKEALDYLSIDESLYEEFFLVDYKTRLFLFVHILYNFMHSNTISDQIRNPTAHVRDYYFFKRSQYPQVELVHMKPEDAFRALQKQELNHKFVEIGKVLLTWAILKNVDMVLLICSFS